MIQTDLIMILSNGRQLGYAEYGDPNGFPIFFFHGFPGSRLQVGDFHTVAHIKHCRFFGIDRPGMGLSSFNKQHSLLSWADDMRELADFLKIEKFSIIAHSGGAPYALACAHKIPERISHIALVSALPPTTLPETKIGTPLGYRIINVLVRNIPGVAWLLMQLQRHVLLNPNIFKKVIQQLPESDRLIFQRSNQMNRMLSSSKEAFNQGVRGAAYEFRLLLKDWGFDLESIHTPVTIWQGALDRQTSLSHAELYKRKLANASLNVCDNEAHVSVLYNQIEEIIDESTVHRKISQSR